MVEMKIFGLALDETSQVPLLILKDLEDKLVLPIWIGAMEAMSISISLNKVNISRPLTHDLMLNTFEMLGVSVQKVVVVDLKEGTYYAELCLQSGDRELIVDCRPSDAIALAVRTEVPIYASKTLLEEVNRQFQTAGQGEIKEESAAKWTTILERFDIDDLKYKM